MNITKKYYVDKDGNMIGYPRFAPTKNEVEAKPFHSKLKISRIGWLNNGFFIELEDESGKTYSMNDVMFSDYIAHNDVYIEGDFNFYKQGTAYSIGL